MYNNETVSKECSQQWSSKVDDGISLLREQQAEKDCLKTVFLLEKIFIQIECLRSTKKLEKSQFSFSILVPL